MQDLVAVGLRHPDFRAYYQRVVLDSQTEQVSRRTRGGVILSAAAVTTDYPLRLAYVMNGRIEEYDEGYINEYHQGAAVVQQLRAQTNDHQVGAVTYSSQLRDRFTGSRSTDFRTAIDASWRARRAYAFDNSLGDCYRAARTAEAGALSTTTSGIGCLGDANSMHWFVRPDGSPERLGWSE